MATPNAETILTQETIDLKNQISAKDPIFKSVYDNAILSGKSIKDSMDLALADRNARTASSKTATGESAIATLERQSGLRAPGEPTNCLSYFKDIFARRPEQYKAYLHILIDGVDAVGQKSVYVDEVGKTHEVGITTYKFKRLHRYAQRKELALLKTMTPAGKKGAFEPYGTEGIICALNQKRLNANPVTGPQKNSPSLVEYVLNQIHPKFVETLEQYCQMVKARAYLALPAMAFGSLQRVVGAMNGVVGAIQKVVYSVYKGVINLIKQFYAYINGIISKIQKMMMDLIEQIIPLDLICMILEAVQVIMDDINFFTSLFGQSGSIFQYLNSFQNYINLASNAVSNPFSTLSAYLPPEINNIIQMVDQIGSDPNGFLTDQLSNFGYAWAVNALQGDILGAVINKYGAQYAAIGPVSQLLNSSEGYARGMGYFPPTPAVVGPNVYMSNGQPVNCYSVPANPAQVTMKNLGIDKVGDAIKDLGNALIGK
jgi:hypothetical protein